MRDPATGGLLTVANADTNARVAPTRPAGTMPPWLASVLGFLTVVAGAPAAIVAALAASSVAAPVWLVTAAAVGSVVAPMLGAGAYWAAGGNPMDALKRFTPKTPEEEAREKKGPNP